MEFEPVLTNVKDHDLVNIVVTPDFKSAGFMVATTSIHKAVIFTDIVVSQVKAVTFFNVQKIQMGQRCWLCRTDQTVVMEHTAPDFQTFRNSTEICTGIGAVTTGYRHCGVETTMCNEQNPVFAAWLRQKGKHVVEGDISDPQVVQHMSQVTTGVLSGGISCQPWSTLGDQKAFEDDRSKSMPGALVAIHLLQIPLAVLECTPAIMQSSEAQSMLHKFSIQTGRTIQQKLLSLHTFWPARRQRWWAIIAHPSLHIQPIPEIPPLVFQPSLLHLMPKFMQLSDEELHALRLDDHEMEEFLTTKKGMCEHQVDNLKA